MGNSRGISAWAGSVRVGGGLGVALLKKPRQPTQPSKQPIIETTGKIQRGADSTEL